MKFIMKNSVVYSFNVDKGLFSSDISDSEMKALSVNVSNNKSNYLTNYGTYRNEMIRTKIKAEELRSQKSKNINSRAALANEIATKKAELQITMDTLKDLKARAEQSKLQIRNFQVEINQKNVMILNPQMSILKNAIRSMQSMKVQVEGNRAKISNIKLIDPNELNLNNMKLKSILTEFRGTFMESDPFKSKLSTLIAHLETEKNNIPTLLH